MIRLRQKAELSVIRKKGGIRMKPIFRRLGASLLAAACLTAAGLPSALFAEAAGESTFRRRVVDAWDNLRESVSMFGVSMTVDDCIREYYDLLYTAADRFYVSSAFGYSSNGANVYGFWARYSYDTAKIPAMKLAFAEKLAEVLSGVQPEWSEAETVLYFHDWLATHCAYDLTYTRNDAYAAMVDGDAVCQGYALAMCVLCREVGIACYPVTSNKLKHMWNVVRVDGEWYHCDVTYDDISPDMLGHSMHEYVLVSDEFMRSDGMHDADDWNFFAEGNEVVCSSKRYENAFWRGAIDAVTPLPDGTWLYAKKNDSVQVPADVYARILRTGADGQSEEIATVQATWPTASGNIYTNCYTAAEVWDGRIYYHTRSDIYSMAMDGSDVQKLYTLSAEEKQKGYLFGILIAKDGLLTYQVMDQPMFADETMTMDADYHTIQLEKSASTDTTGPPAETTTTTEAVTTESTTESLLTESSTESSTESETEPATAEPVQTDSTEPETQPATEPFTETAEQTTTVTETSAEDSTEPLMAVLHGDTDVNGRVQIADAILLARFNAEDEGITLTAQGRLNADCNGDGLITADDNAWILELLAGLR